MWDDEETKEKKRKTLFEETIPFYFKKLDEYAAANGGHLACNKLTWADIYVASWSKYFGYAIKDIFNDYEGYPNLQKMVANVLAIESIKKWVAERPETFC
jgi:glutathione S-transferase